MVLVNDFTLGQLKDEVRKIINEIIEKENDIGYFENIYRLKSFIEENELVCIFESDIYFYNTPIENFSSYWKVFNSYKLSYRKKRSVLDTKETLIIRDIALKLINEKINNNEETW